MRFFALLTIPLLAASLCAQEAAPAAGGAESTTRPATTPAAFGKPVTTDIQPGKMVTFRSTNREIEAYQVSPKVSGNTPAVLLVHDIFGLTDYARSQADELARQGYTVIEPNLYSRLDNGGKNLDAQNAWLAYDKTSDLQIMEDLHAAIEYLNRDPSAPTAGQPLAIVGHDMGGSFAMKMAGTDLRVAAAVNYYGRLIYPATSSLRPTSPVEDLFNLQAPLLSFYGAIDPQVPRQHVLAMESRLENNPNKTYYEMVVMPAVGHGFLVPGRQGYNAQAAAQAAQRTREFLARYLRAEPRKPEE